MQTVPYKQVLHKAARLLGLDPAVNLLDGTAAALTQYINTALAIGWRHYPWPDLQIIEERTVTNSTIADPSSIDMLLDVWAADPRTTPGAEPLTWTEVAGNYYLPRPLESVWVRYSSAPTVHTYEPWSATTTYEAGDLALGTDGNTYQSLAITTGSNPLTSPTSWALVEFPAFLADYCARMALADSLTEDGQNARAMREQDNAWLQLDHQMARYSISQYQTARFGVRT